MSKKLILTEEQLDFISFMKRGVSSNKDLRSRFDSRLATLLYEEGDKSAKWGSGITMYHSPQTMIKFLSLFSRDDRFKWFTHKWDVSAPFDINEMIARLAINKSILSDMTYPKKSGPAVNEKTYNQVWNFINFSNPVAKPYPWKNNRLIDIRYGWYSVIGLSEQKPGFPVENLILSDGHQFKDYIRMFKSVIEFRTDLDYDDRFSELVWENITSVLPKDFSVTFDPKFDEIGYNLNVYCDVIGLLGALTTICNWIVKHKARSSDVIINLTSKKDYYMLEITHVDSYFDNVNKLTNPSGDLDGLRKRLFSVCDITFEGNYLKDGNKNGSLIVTILDSNTKMTDGLLSPCAIQESNNEIEGVKYKLKIYK